IENQKENQAVIAMESRNYKGWEAFKRKFIEDLSIFAEVHPFYVEAISLNFRDEFLWQDKANTIPVKEIFNIDSDLLTSKFLNAVNGTFSLNTQQVNQQKRFEEKTVLSFHNELRRIVLSHQYAQVFEESTLFRKLSEEQIPDG